MAKRGIYKLNQHYAHIKGKERDNKVENTAGAYHKYKRKRRQCKQYKQIKKFNKKY